MKSSLIATTIDLQQQAIDSDLPGATASSPERGFGDLISTLLSGVMTVAAMAAFFYLILGAIEWITSDGDKSKLENARNKITQAIVGLILLAASTALFIILQDFLGICVLDFGGTC